MCEADDKVALLTNIQTHTSIQRHLLLRTSRVGNPTRDPWLKDKCASWIGQKRTSQKIVYNTNALIHCDTIPPRVPSTQDTSLCLKSCFLIGGLQLECNFRFFLTTGTLYRPNSTPRAYHRLHTADPRCRSHCCHQMPWPLHLRDTDGRFALSNQHPNSHKYTSFLFSQTCRAR